MEEDSRILELEKRIAELQADVEELKKIKMAEVVHTMQALNTSEASDLTVPMSIIYHELAFLKHQYALLSNAVR